MKPANTKTLLREKIIPAQCALTPYFSTDSILRAMQKVRRAINPSTLNRYLVDLVKEGVLYDSGRGWYSRIKTPFILDTAPVTALAGELSKGFPLITFSCWSTEQVKTAMHHLLSRFVTFVDAEPDAMESVHEYLRDAGWDSWINPRGAEAGRFNVREKTVVVRREIRKRPSHEPLACVEKLLVELCFEVRDLKLMAPSEFHSMLANLAGTKRIRIATLLGYAAERTLSLKRLLGENNQLIPTFYKSRR